LQIKEIRQEKNYSQKAVALVIGVSVAAYNRIENGGTQITLNVLELICSALNTNIHKVLQLDDATSVTNNNSLVMNNVNHGQLHVNLSDEQFKKISKELASK
jgi:transcriptional regulator with XRE-family HTH domain